MSLFLGRMNRSSKYLSKYFIKHVEQRTIHTTCSCNRYDFWIESPKDKWRNDDEYERMEKEMKEEKRKNWYGLKDGFKDVRREVWKWKDEWHSRLTDDSMMNVTSGDWDKYWDLTNPSELKRWQTACDADHKIGFSSCEFNTSPTGHALFQGYINARVPREGKIIRTGYCNITSMRPQKSFNRDTYYDFGAFTHLILRVRGDGRSYMINLATPGDYDITWHDIYHYPLYTRGGPYWQYVKIPFSKFIFGYKGSAQDMQCEIPLDRIATVGFTVAKIEGPFSLEIDYVGVEFDPRTQKLIDEDHAYESYLTAPGMPDS